MLSEIKDTTKVFSYFEEISKIPRGSGNNKKISDYLVLFANEHKLEYKQDIYQNVIIIKEASEGYENLPTLILQGHMDMVCEKEAGIEHDFTEEGLEIYVQGDFVCAKGTTLGGDDGIAIAYALAILADEKLKHPRLEVIITTDEEIGMDGAFGLDTSSLLGKYLINIDSEEEGTFLVSCAGGLTGICELPLERKRVNGTKIEINIAGLKGGHSGTEIDKNRTNAIILMARLLFELQKELDFSILEIQGGMKDNAIPREAKATIIIEKDKKELFLSILDRQKGIYKKELEKAEENLFITENILENQTEEKIVNVKDILFLLLNAPNGVQVFSSNIEGLVESSLNLGIFRTEKTKAVFCYSIRSSVYSYKIFLSNKLAMLATKVGGIYHEKSSYPAWEYQNNSKLRAFLSALYQEQYGKEPKITAIHAGLECGILAEKIKEVDIISMGPDIFDIHTPKERLSISSTQRIYAYLVKIIEQWDRLNSY